MRLRSKFPAGAKKNFAADLDACGARRDRIHAQKFTPASAAKIL